MEQYAVRMHDVIFIHQRREVEHIKMRHIELNPFSKLHE